MHIFSALVKKSGGRTQSFSSGFGLDTCLHGLQQRSDFGDVRLDALQVETKAIGKVAGGRIELQRSGELNLR